MRSSSAGAGLHGPRRFSRGALALDYAARVLRSLPLLVTALTGCTFYISGGTGTGDGGSDSPAQPDAFLVVDAPDVDAPIDSSNPPVDTAPDSFFPPLDAFTFDVVIPPLDGLVPDIIIPLPDAATPDASVPGWMVIETISVPCSGQVVASQTMLATGVTYRVRASGQCKVGSFLGADILADAEYQGTLLPRDKDNNIDTGIAINDTTLGSNKFPHWGNYTSTHRYEISGPGQGAPITLRYHDNATNAYGDNTGALTIEILAQ
jgi:hypothetical protein